MSKPSFIITVIILGLSIPLSFVSAGTILSSQNYAWSNNSGYINFADVTVSDSALGGYAWSANDGWINFSPTLGGVLNDGAGNLSGYAWGERLGWIDFEGVVIGTDGKFAGTATGTLLGTLTFDCPVFCDVATDWLPLAVVEEEGGSPGRSASETVETELPVTTTTPAEDQLAQEAEQVDVVKDGQIDVIDFNLLMVNWGKDEAGNIADMNLDNSVDIIDFNILMIYWGVIYTL